MDMRPLHRKSGSSDSLGTMDLLFEKGLQQAFNLKFRTSIYLCFGFILFSLCVFLFCTLDPEIVLEQQSRHSSNEARDKSGTAIGQLTSLQSSIPLSRLVETQTVRPSPALQGMGTLFRKGTKSMSELLVAHLSENTTESDFRLFLRTLHRSGATARADVVFLFPSATVSTQMQDTIIEEENSFQKLLSFGKRMDRPTAISTPEPPADFSLAYPIAPLSPFNFFSFRKSDERGAEANRSTYLPDDEGRWGSIIGFDLQELDPDNALKGFFTLPSVQLRRWICYQMLLGMVRQRYRQVLLTDIDGVAIVADALSVVRKKQNLYLTMEDRTWSDIERTDNSTKIRDMLSTKARREILATGMDGEEDTGIEELKDLDTDHDEVMATTEMESIVRDSVEKKIDSVNKRKGGRRPDSKKKQSKKGKVKQQQAKTQQSNGLIESIYGKELWNSLDKFDRSRNVINSGVIMGDITWIRVLTNKMATEIVRVALQRKDLQQFHDKALLNYLVFKSSVLGKKALEHLRVVENRDSVVHSLRGTKIPNTFFRAKGVRFSVIHGYRDESVDKVRADGIAVALHNDICSSEQQDNVYEDCQKSTGGATYI